MCPKKEVTTVTGPEYHTMNKDQKDSKPDQKKFHWKSWKCKIFITFYFHNRAENMTKKATFSIYIWVIPCSISSKVWIMLGRRGTWYHKDWETRVIFSSFKEQGRKRHPRSGKYQYQEGGICAKDIIRLILLG